MGRKLGYRVLLASADDLGGADHDAQVRLAARARASRWEKVAGEEETSVKTEGLLIVTQEMAARFAKTSLLCDAAEAHVDPLRGRGDGRRSDSDGGGGVRGGEALPGAQSSRICAPQKIL